jgi:thiosulfate/3-mercaptopyruvate sulfurtransferase
MKQLSKILIAALAVLGASLAFAQQLPGPIVTADWLAANQAQVQLVDVRSDTKSYSRQSVTSVDKKTGKVQVEEVGGVIPGALLVDYALVRGEKMLDGQKTKYLIASRCGPRSCFAAPRAHSIS